MIRLPPTSISLSDSDVQVHLREISIYQSLLEQGFTRQAVQQYYASMRVPEAECHPSLQDPQLTDTHKAGSNGERPITPEDRLVVANNSNQLPQWPAPTESSGEVVRGANDARQMRTHQESQSATRAAEYVEPALRRSVYIPEQIAYEKASREPGHAETDARIIVVPTSQDTPFAPSTVELRARLRIISDYLPPVSQDLADNYGDQASQAREGHSQFGEEENNGEDTSNVHLPPLASNEILSIRSRPRQSSMLHIIRNAASPSSSEHSDDSFKSTVTKMPPTATPEFERSLRTRVITYRQRSQTYPWVQSEADESKDAAQSGSAIGEVSASQAPQGEYRSTPTEVRQVSVNNINSPPNEIRPRPVTRAHPSPTGTTIITAHRHISSPHSLDPEAEDFVPLKLPSPFSATRRISPVQASLPSSVDDSSPSILHHGMHTRSSPTLAVSTPPRSSSIGSITRHLGSCFASSPDRDFPSSPPRLGNIKRSPESGLSRRESTMTRNREHETVKEILTRVLPKTPRTQARAQQTDGPGTVYDDRVPAYLQPKTPADLTRGVHVTDREVAYTAPPGRTTRTPATISHTFLSPSRPVDPGEESPSRRARTIRERRERELRRSAIMEEGIWERLREMESDTVAGRIHWDRSGSGLTTSWRDDFGADRLGEENFDEEGIRRLPRLEPTLQGSVRATRRRGP